MSLPWYWDCLDLGPEAGSREVKRRYSQLLKLNRPEDNPQGFQQLRRAYEICLQLAREREASGDAAPAPAAAVQPVPDAPDAAPVAPHPVVIETLTEAGDAGLPAPPPQPSAAPQPFRLDEAIPPPTRVDGEPPPAPAQKVDAAQIGKFHTVDMALPRLRPATEIVDELLQLDASDPAALPHWFGHCPELVNFAQRDAVELELLQRLVAGARPGLAALKLAGDEFGWRELGFARRLATRGISGPRWQAIDEALHQAYAEAQFSSHLQRGGRLLDEHSLPAEKRLLARLHAQRGGRPSLWRAFQGTDVLRINRLLRAYADHYGGRALYHLFGATFLDFWRDAHPGSAPNWLRLRLLVLRVASYLLPLWLALLVLAGQNKQAEPAVLGMNQPQAGLSVVLLLLATGLIGYGSANLAFQHVQQQVWPRFKAWRERVLERQVEPWLQPLRALPLLLVLAGLLALLHRWPGEAAGTALCLALVLAVFGFSGLTGLLCASLLLGASVLEWLPEPAPWFTSDGIRVASVALVWGADRLARWWRGTQQSRAGLRFGLSLALAVLAVIATQVLHDTLAS